MLAGSYNAMVLVVMLLVAVISYFGNWHARWKFRHIPGPKPSFPYGNTGTVRKKKMFRAYADWQAQFGDTFRIFLVRQPMLITADPQLVRQITVKDFNKFHDRYVPSRTLHTGKRLEAARSIMPVARGPFWGSIRAAAQPMFHTKHLTSYADTINQAVDDLMVHLDRFAESAEEVDMLRQLGRMTMQVIGNAAFGVDFKTQSSGAEEIPLVKAAKTVFVNGAPNVWELAVQAVPSFLVPLVRLLSRTFPSQAGLEAEEAFATIYGTSDTLIENSRKKYNSNSKKPAPWTWFKSDPDHPLQDTVPAENSVISMLMKANNKATGAAFTPVQIAAQTNTMILAGYETTANTLAYSLYLLGKHPQAQQRLLQEVDQFQGRPGYDSLHHFPYAAAVISETLRLHPAAAIMNREATENVQLGPYYIPRGTGVHINLYAMQHDERYWQDAEAFKPERWVGDKTGGDRSGGLAYMPFGMGPRMCIGIKLALEEATIAIVRLHQNYTFQLSPKLMAGPLEVTVGITMSPKGGVPVTVVRRKAGACNAVAAGA